jgi:hypothetical protein
MIICGGVLRKCNMLGPRHWLSFPRTVAGKDIYYGFSKSIKRSQDSSHRFAATNQKSDQKHGDPSPQSHGSRLWYCHYRNVQKRLNSAQSHPLAGVAHVFGWHKPIGAWATCAPSLRFRAFQSVPTSGLFAGLPGGLRGVRRIRGFD